MRKSLLTLLTFVLCFGTNSYAQDYIVTDEKISVITERLQNYSNDELLERREYLISQLELDEDQDNTPELDPVSRSEMLLELSILEQLLVIAGLLILENVTDGTSVPPDPVVPPDTTPPVITVIGDNPATVELGNTYIDLGATADGGESVSVSGTVDVFVAGSYTLTYTATDDAGNVGTATRIVNVVDTVAPVFTSASTFTIDENQNVIGTISATDLAGVTLFTGDGGSRYEFTGGVDNTSSPATLILSPSAITDGYNDYETIQSFGCSTGYEANGYTLKARDPSGNETIQNVCIQLNNLNDNTPSITSDASFSAVENQTAIGTVTAEDADGDLNDLVFSISGTDILIDSSSGVLTFAIAFFFTASHILVNFCLLFPIDHSFNMAI